MRRLMFFGGIVLSCVAMPAAGQSCAGFTDVSDPDPRSVELCPAVQWLKNRSITTGCGGTLYCPDTLVSRWQMALFLHRMGQRGDVVWVAPSGGDFPSIQAGIDYAAAHLPASPINSVLVKIAPGVYNEQVTLKDYVDLEGSGMNATFIAGNGSGGTMIAGANTEVRNLTVLNTHNGTVPDAAFAVYQTGNSAAGFTLFTHVSLQADGPTDNVSVQILGGAMTIEEGRLGAANSGATGVAVPIHANGAGTQARVRNSILASNPAATPRYAAYVDGGATMYIENTQIGGDTFGTPACFNTYNPAFVAKGCL